MSDHDQHVAHLRSVRDIALSESDFSQLPDVLSAEDKALWATYRQELRDFPSTFPDEITPENVPVLPMPPGDLSDG
jgi:hypothetical protein